MPRTPLTVNALSGASLPGAELPDPAATAADAVNGNTAPNSGMTILRVKNTDTAPHTLTIVSPGTVGGLAVANDPRTIPASSTVWIGRLPVDVHGSTLNLTVDSALLQLTVFEP